MNKREFENNLRINMGGLTVQLLADDFILRKGETRSEAWFGFLEHEPCIFLNIHLKNMSSCRQGKKILELENEETHRTLYYTEESFVLQSNSQFYPHSYCARMNLDGDYCDLYFSDKKMIRTRGLDLLAREFRTLFVVMYHLKKSFEGLFLHASAINDNGYGRIFAGKSGSGKSTLARLWNEKKGCEILCDDMVIIRKMNNVFKVYGTPWTGSIQLCSSEETVLKEIFLIKHGRCNVAHRLSGQVIFRSLLNSSAFDFSFSEVITRAFDILDQISRNIPCYELGFVPNEKVVDFIRQID
jgi:hypothetical protein